MADIFAEVDEAIKRERLEKYWKSYGNLLIGGVLVVILATGGYSAYTSWHKRATLAQTDAFLKAVAADDPFLLAEASQDLSPGLETIAKVKAADEYMIKNDVTGAAALYAEIAKDESAPTEFKDIARFMSAKLQYAANAEETLKIMQEIATDEKSIMRLHAHLEAALILAHKLNNYTEARKHLASITSMEEVPPTLKVKASGMDVIYALKESEQKSRN